MSISVYNKSKRIENKRATDPFDILIFEKGLRAAEVIPDKKLGVLIVVLNNGKSLKVSLNDYKKLKKASQKQLDNWEFSGGGIGIHWSEIDEDLSIKGMLKDAALNAVLHQLQGKKIIFIDASIKKHKRGMYFIQARDGKGNIFSGLISEEKALASLQPE